MDETDSMDTFIDDFLFRTLSPHKTELIFRFFTKEGRQLGLDMNDSKTKLHALHGAPPAPITVELGFQLSGQQAVQRHPTAT